MRKDAPQWTEKHDRIIVQIKQQCQELPPLQIPGPGKKIVQTDASQDAWGAVLLEEVEHNGKVIG